MSEGLELARRYPPGSLGAAGQVYGALWLVPREQRAVALDPAF